MSLVSSIWNRLVAGRRSQFTGRWPSFEAVSQEQTLNAYDENCVTSFFENYNRSIENLSTIPSSAERQKKILGPLLKNRSRIVDFGGALGHHYFFLKRIFPELSFESWSVVELPEFASVGSEKYANSELKFGASFEKSLQAKPNFILFSGSLQYTAHPEKVLAQASQSGAQIFLDRLPVNEESESYCCVQSIHSFGKPIKIPVWCLSRSKLLRQFEELGLKIEASWTLPHESLRANGVRLASLGFLLSKAGDLQKKRPSL